jgi:hypothetical protein
MSVTARARGGKLLVDPERDLRPGEHTDGLVDDVALIGAQRSPRCSCSKRVLRG